MRSKILPSGCGFTLIEMLVVLLIMAVVAGLVTAIARPDDRAVLRVEAERLARLLDMATEESRLSGKSIAWTSDGRGYRFWRYRDGAGWSEIRDTDVLRERILPPAMAIAELRVENIRPQGVMRLEFTPYGPALAFTIDMALGAGHYAVAGSAIGVVRALPIGGTGSDEVALR